MIPNEFYEIKGLTSLYIKDFNTEDYFITPQNFSYRIDIRRAPNNGNCTYHYKIFANGSLLTINGWCLNRASFHKAWSENYSPTVSLTDPHGIRLDAYTIPDPFSIKERNTGGEVENRLRETFKFFNYISQFKSLDDFNTIHKVSLSNIDDVIRFYLEFLKIKDRLPQNAIYYVSDTIKKEFESYLEKKKQV